MHLYITQCTYWTPLHYITYGLILLAWSSKR